MRKGAAYRAEGLHVSTRHVDEPLSSSSPLSSQAANVGDSSALVVDAVAGTWSQLTADHRIANSSSERQRLLERGHTVKKRLYGLNISRMLGDRCGLCTVSVWLPPLHMDVGGGIGVSTGAARDRRGSASKHIHSAYT